MKWNQHKLEDFIKNKVEENLNLDYKASGSLQKNDKKANEISKDVSAFANSDGGIIIYGIKENYEKKHLPDSIDPINRNEISKEWLEQIIQSRIRPRIENVEIFPVTIDDSLDLVVYIVEIPQSDTAHQANDRKYYRRYNFSSEPMYDYEIRDIINRTKQPRIDLEFWITKQTYEVNPHVTKQPKFYRDSNGFPQIKGHEKEFKTDYWLNIRAVNNGKILTDYINAYIIIDSVHLLEEDQEKGEKTKLFMDNTIRDVVDVKPGFQKPIPRYGPSRYDPILPKRTKQLDSIQLCDNIINSDSIIEWIVYADNSEPRKGSIVINQIKVIE
jgi:hypothetical protein